jgi:hypothetical protein
MLETVRGSSWVYWVAAKKPFFNNVSSLLAGLVLGLFWWLGCSLSLSVVVGVVEGGAYCWRLQLCPRVEGLGERLGDICA